MSEPKLIILCGGLSPERDISIMSGQAIAKALKGFFNSELIELEDDILPEFISAKEHIVFPAMHGPFGEDGQLQKLMEDKGIEFIGSDSSASKLCMDKVATKKHLEASGVILAPQVTFEDPTQLDIASIISQLGEDLFLKPVNMGSSLDLFHVQNRAELVGILGKIERGFWMLEKRIKGREITVGVIGGIAQIPIEIITQNTFYDYREKYTKGISCYDIPPKLDKNFIAEIQAESMKIFKECGCRDFARLDYMLSEAGELVFIEINTIPGFTENSLIPKAAVQEGVFFDDLCKLLVNMGINRFCKSLKVTT